MKKVYCLLLLMSSVVCTVFANTFPYAVSGSPSLGSILKPDSTLDFSRILAGSFNAAGFQMVSAPGEAPRFAPAFNNSCYSDDFNVPGFNGEVKAVVVVGTDIYVGGSFTTVEGVTVNNIAKWNGSTSTWSALANGVNNTVNALATDGLGNRLVPK